MSSVQHRRSFDGFWKLKNRDMAVEEIIRERRATIMSGKLKGRRLFEAAERAAEVELDWNDDEMYSDCFNLLGEKEVNNENLKRNQEDLGTCFRPSCPFLGSSLPDEKVEISESVVVEGEAGGASRNLRGGDSGGERCMLALIWFAFVSMLFTLGLIISMRRSDKYELEKEAIIVPT
ncbi:unnamed protein product [Fraxinus pennsylvanica]|uniref:Uncharacterized protein n=1 Tax=Fraxinus pennsylvanica TaxID=56036 RepID=A0AAD2AGV7_9LAMI|nr:unnamed protein product [Fraxinus pennsylvanica]